MNGESIIHEDQKINYLAWNTFGSCAWGGYLEFHREDAWRGFVHNGDNFPSADIVVSVGRLAPLIEGENRGCVCEA